MAVPLPLATFLALDLLAAVLMLAVAGSFYLAWRRSGADLYLLTTLGFAFLGVSYVAVSSGQFEFSPGGEWDVLRIAGQTAGALILAAAYLSVRAGLPSFWRTLGWVVAAGAALVMALYLAPPLSELPPIRDALVVAHVVQASGLALCFWLSSEPLRRRMAAETVLVPAGFMALALGKYTWLLIDLAAAEVLMPFAYAWRYVGIGFFLVAVWYPRFSAERLRQAPA